MIDTMVALTLYNNWLVEDIGEWHLTGYVSRRGDWTRQKYCAVIFNVVGNIVVDIWAIRFLPIILSSLLRARNPSKFSLCQRFFRLASSPEGELGPDLAGKGGNLPEGIWVMFWNTSWHLAPSSPNRWGLLWFVTLHLMPDALANVSFH